MALNYKRIPYNFSYNLVGKRLIFVFNLLILLVVDEVENMRY